MVMVNILLFGKEGRLGRVLASRFSSLGQMTVLGKANCDVTDRTQLKKMIHQCSPDIIVNATGYTNVDQAELDVANANLMNATVPANLAQFSTDCGALLVHFSTDYVFDGTHNRPYKENDVPNPLSVYGKSKLIGEKLIASYAQQFLIFRTSWLYGVYGDNFLKTVLRFAVKKSTMQMTKDERGTPSATQDIAQAVFNILAQYLLANKADFPYGLYHLCSKGMANRYQYAKTIVDCAQGLDGSINSNNQVMPIASYDKPDCAVRPKNVQLDTTLLYKTFGVELPIWQDSVCQVVSDLMNASFNDWADPSRLALK